MSPARRPPSGGGKPRGGKATGGKSSGGKPGRGGAGRGAAPRPSGGGRAGATRGRPEPGPPIRTAPKGLGGEQVEGRQAVRELLLAGQRKVHEVVMAADLDRAPIIDDILELAADQRVPVRHMARSKVDAMARTDAPQGVVARASALRPVDIDDMAFRPKGMAAPFLLALDGVTDPGNVGALLRSAEGAGITGVVLPRHRAVHVTPAVTKSAAGAVEHLPMALVGGLPAALARLRELGVWIIGLDMDGDRPVWELDVGDQPVCLVLGAEGGGLSRLTRARCDQVVSIPLRGRLGSLNVAAAGAIACFEVARGRPA